MGIHITPKTPKAEIDRICANFPQVKALIDKLENHGNKEKSTKQKD